MSEFKLLDHTAALVLLFKEAPYCLHSGVSISHSRPQGTGSRFSTSSPTLAVPWIWAAAVPEGGSLCSSLEERCAAPSLLTRCHLSFQSMVVFFMRNACVALVVLNLTSAASPASGLSPTPYSRTETRLSTPLRLYGFFS